MSPINVGGESEGMNDNSLGSKSRVFLKLYWLECLEPKELQNGEILGTSAA
jgi:hypothetical protein